MVSGLRAVVCMLDFQLLGSLYCSFGCGSRCRLGDFCSWMLFRRECVVGCGRDCVVGCGRDCGV